MMGLEAGRYHWTLSSGWNYFRFSLDFFAFSKKIAFDVV